MAVDRSACIVGAARNLERPTGKRGVVRMCQAYIRLKIELTGCG
jgi:hypothetical protein